MFLRAVPIRNNRFQSDTVGGSNFKVDSGAHPTDSHIGESWGIPKRMISVRFYPLAGPDELECLVPYPYTNPSLITASDYAWLEHALLFLFKSPREFGAKLWNGLYFKLAITEHGLVGTPQAVDLNKISSPPDNPKVPPFGPEERDAIKPGVHWITSLTIR